MDTRKKHRSFHDSQIRPKSNFRKEQFPIIREVVSDGLEIFLHLPDSYVPYFYRHLPIEITGFYNSIDFRSDFEVLISDSVHSEKASQPVISYFQ